MNSPTQIFILFLRAINVSGKNIIKMAELKDSLIQNGFENVKTYIQSGNIILESPKTKAEIQHNVYRIIQENFKLDIAIFIYTQSELIELLNKNPYKSPLEGNKVFLTFTNSSISNEASSKLSTMDLGEEVLTIKEKIIFFYLPFGMAKSKLNNSFLEKYLNISCTGRNRNTIEKIVELCN